VSEITDQNHVGGARFVLELAHLAGVSQGTHVLDLGCGLGGAARLLADRYGCRVTGIDVSPERCRDAVELTSLVGLSALVSFQCADLRSIPVPPDSCDVIWGQAAWSHFPNKQRFVRRWARALHPAGRIAFEDACLGDRRPTAAARTLEKLQQRWNCDLIPRDEWIGHVARAGFRDVSIEDETGEMIAYLRKLSNSSRHLDAAQPEEAAAWNDALHLAETGVLTYVRITGRKS
jgi:SAM-dependent methyltransferase